MNNFSLTFRLCWYETKEENKYSTEDRYEFIGSRDAVWKLWYNLHRVQGYPHVEVYSLDGHKCNMGVSGMLGDMVGYCI
jgi:hypothetical protein